MKAIRRRHKITDLAYWHLCFSLCAIMLLSGCAMKRVDEARFNLRLIAHDEAGGGDAAISPDGRRFVCSSKRAGNWDVWIYEIGSNRWSPVTTDPADDFEAQWSPDGTRLAFTSTRSGNKDVWILSLADGTEKRITDSPEDDEYPAWSPDGRLIVYTGGPWEGRNFYVISSEGGQARELRSKPGKAGACSFTPDGESVVCHAYDSGSGDLSKLSLNGGQPVPLTSGTEWDYKPYASPDGHWVAFSRSEQGKSAIWLMPLGGGSALPLTSEYANDRWPTWSASGNNILFHRISDKGAGVKILDRATNEVRTVVPGSENPMEASFDPQAQNVVYSAHEKDRRTIRILNLSTGAAENLYTGSGDADFPRWSPDGKRIAFMAIVKDRWEICTINPDATGLVVWTGSEKRFKSITGPFDWSPDGTHRVFKADTAPFESDLFILDTASGKVRNLTDDSWFDESPSWTPDSRAILFMSTRGGGWTWGLFRLSLSDGSISEIAPPDYTEKNFPRSDKDGRVVWSFYEESGVETLAERSPAGKISTVGGAGPGARWPSYSSDGRLLLFTTIEHRIEYWLAENLFSPGSSLEQLAFDHAPAAVPGGEAERAAAPDFIEHPATVRISPVDLHHR